MRLTKAADYGLLLVAYLLARPAGARASIKTAAADCRIPPRFLATIVRQLGQAGLVATARGVQGGVALTEAGAAATLRQVIEAIEGTIGLVDCQRRPGLCEVEPDCFMRAFWGEVRGRFLEALGGTTVAELASRAAGRRPESAPVVLRTASTRRAVAPGAGARA